MCTINRLPSVLATPAKSLTTQQGGEVWTAGHSFEILDLGLLHNVWRARCHVRCNSRFRIHREDMQWPLRIFSSPRSRSATLSDSTARHTSEWLGEPLSDADATLQSMTDASPAKWHLPHTTWFFVAMVLSPHLQGYRPFDERFTFLFNSYYEALGARQPRPRRGMITRPALDEVYVYRTHVDQAVASLLGLRPTREVAELIELGCHHERRHQELLLTDILHLLAQNPIRPAYRDPAPVSVETAASCALLHRLRGGNRRDRPRRSGPRVRQRATASPRVDRAVPARGPFGDQRGVDGVH